MSHGSGLGITISTAACAALSAFLAMSLTTTAKAQVATEPQAAETAAMSEPVIGFLHLVGLQDMPDVEVSLLQQIYGAETLSVSAQDFDRDGTPEFVVRRDDHCNIVGEPEDTSMLISICPWSIVDENGGLWGEVMRMDGWRGASLLAPDGDPVPVGIKIDGIEWYGLTTGVMLPRPSRALDWGSVEDLSPSGRDLATSALSEAMLTSLELGEFSFMGTRMLLTRSSAPAAVTSWSLVANDRILVTGTSRGSPAPALAETGQVMVLDTGNGGEVLRSVWLPMSRQAWRDLWDNPDMPEGWVSINLERLMRPEADPDGLWLASEIQQVRDAGFATWFIARAEMSTGDGDVLVLSSLNTTCSSAGCIFRGEIRRPGGEEIPVLFDGAPETMLCLGSPDRMALSPQSGGVRACGQIVALDMAW